MDNFIGQIIRLSVVDSTNIYTSKKLSQYGMKEWTVVVADQQTLGRGQRGKSWQSELGKNLLMSVYIKPTAIKQDHQFLISAAAGLAVIKTLREYEIDARLKWPNDVLVGGEKICGLLIENQWRKERIESCIIGIGLNVNQISFNNYDWPAVSMASIKGISFDLDEVMQKSIHNLKQLISIAETRPAVIWTHYQLALYGLKQTVKFNSQGEVLEGVLQGVNEAGALNIRTEKGVLSFINGEIKLIRT